MSGINIGRFRGGFCVYWNEGGKRRRYQLKAQSVADAEREAIDVYRAKMPRKEGLTVADIWAEYIADLGDKPSAKTLGYTGKAVLPAFGHLRPDQITRAMCKAYDEKRRGDGKTQGTVHTELGHLNMALNFAKKVGLSQHSVTIWRPQKPDSNMRILTMPEVSKLIDACREPHVRLAVTLLFGTAARVGAILDLTWDRVDFDRGVINLRLDDAVTRKGRAVLPMNGTTRAALSAAHEAALSDYVVEYKGGQIKKIRTGFSAAVERSGIGHVRIHDIRHTAAVTMLGAGVPMEKVSQVLGHSNTATTERVYARYLPQHMSDAVNVLDFGKVRGL